MAKTEIKGVAVNTPEGRVSYPSVFKPRANDMKQGALEYNLTIVWGPEADLAVLDEAIFKAGAELFGSDTANWPENFHSPLRANEDAWKKDEKTGKKIPSDAYPAGGFHIRPWTAAGEGKPRPKVVDANVVEILDETKFYGGCWAIAAVTFKAYNFKNGATTGVGVYLTMVQKTRDDKPFGADRNPENFFKPVAQPVGEAQVGGAKTAAALFRGRKAPAGGADPMA